MKPQTQNAGVAGEGAKSRTQQSNRPRPARRASDGAELEMDDFEGEIPGGVLRYTDVYLTHRNFFRGV